MNNKEYTYDYEDGEYDVFGFIKDLSTISHTLCKMADFVDNGGIEYEDENYYIPKISKALQDIFADANLFLDNNGEVEAQNKEYEELAQDFHSLLNLSYHFTKKLDDSKKFHNQLVKRQALVNINNSLTECEKNLKTLQEYLLDNFVKAEFIGYKKAQELYKYFNENSVKYFLFDIEPAKTPLENKE